MIRRLAVPAMACVAATTVHAQGLFRDAAPLQVTIVTELRNVVRDRDSTKFAPHPATLTYRDSAGRSVSFPATLRARGHFRRQARNCGFPPLKLEFQRSAVQRTLFQGNEELKITTNCRPGNAEYEQYILQEYALYRAYQAVSPRYFRTRLARITYHDSTSATPDVQSWAFFIEEDKEVARHYELKVDGSKGALFADLQQQQLAITALFEYMVANTDWSISALHNVSLMRDSVGGYFPVAYDFDWSGAVNTRYAFPDARLGISKTTDRLYRGPCLSPEQWTPVIDRFNKARPAIEATYAALPELDAGVRQRSLAWWAESFRIINDPRQARRAFETCLPKGM